MAHDEHDNLTERYDSTVLGTADYLAPEQATDSHGVDIRADIYSLGATFYFLLTGKSPFGEGTVAQKLIWHQTRQPKPIGSFRDDVPEARMIPFFVQIKCHLGKAYAVADALAESEIASEIYSTAGDYDLLVKFYVEKETDIGHFVTEKVQTIPGIQDTRTIITFKAF